MRRIPVLVAALAVTVVAAGCGSSGGSTSSGPSSTSSTSAAPTPEAKVLTAALLRPADLPGWKHQPQKPSADSVAEVKQLAAGIPTCDNLVAKIVDGTEKRRSDKFAKGDLEVRNSTELYPSTEAVAAQLDLYLDPTTIDCYRELFRKTLTDQGFTVNSLDVSPIAVDHVGDGEFGFRLTTSVTGQGRTVQLLTDQIGVQLGKYTLSLETTAPDTAGLAQLETTLLPKLVDRMKQAGA